MGDKGQRVLSLSSAKWRRGSGRGGAFKSVRNKPLSPCPLPAALRGEREKTGNILFHHLFLCLVAALLLPALRAADDPFADIVRRTDPLTPEQERQKFHLPPGFEIRLVASEPQISKPMNMAFDGRGRLWITESREYPFPAPSGKKGRDAIKILVDRDGDGAADEITTFADGLNIPIGIYPCQGGAIALSIPNIYRFTDTNDDGKADGQSVLYGPIGFDKDTHGLTSAFRRGYDGWLYACHGFNNTTTLRGSDGSSITMNSGNTYRMRLDGSRVEQFTWGQVNPFGLAFDPMGNLYSADCHSSPIYQLIRGGYYPSFGKPNDGLGFAPAMMHHSHGSTAIGGIVFYADQQFPREFRENFFVGNVMTCRINRDQLVLHGSTPEAREAPDFLSCDDPWFRPVDLQLGPDGALYVADFYNRIIGHYEVPLDHPGRDRERGRIWRIAWLGSASSAGQTPSPKKPLLDLPHESVESVIGFLGHPNLTVRMLAMNELTDRFGLAAADPVLAAVNGDSTPSQKIHGLWVLHRLGVLETNFTLDRLVKDREPAVRAHAMRVLAEMPELAPPRLTFLRRGLSDLDPFVQRAAADALGRHPVFENIEPLLHLLRDASPADTHLIHVARMALRNQLENGVNFRALTTLDLAERDYQLLAGVALGVHSPEAAAFLLAYLQKYPPPGQLPDYLRHVARYGPDSAIPSLARLARDRVSTDLDLQLTLLNSVEEGAAQRGSSAGRGVAEWAAELAQKLLASPGLGGDGWAHGPVEETVDSQNPWVLQQRSSSDGRPPATFISSLKQGGESLTGILRSPPFDIPDHLSFFVAGHDGYPGKPAEHKNSVRLSDAQTGAIIAETFAPRNDVAQPVRWDLAGRKGRKGRLEIVDRNHQEAFAWIAAGRFDPEVIKLPSVSPSQVSQRQQAAADLAARFKISALAPRLAGLFASAQTDLDTRAAAAKALLALPAHDRRLAFGPLIAEPTVPIALRLRLSDELARKETNTPAALLEIFQSLPAQGQTRIARLLSGTASGRAELLNFIEAGAVSARLLLDTRVKDQVMSEPSPELRERIKRLTKDLTPPRLEIQKLIAERRASYDPATAQPVEGAAVFQKNCGVCHQIDGQGGLVGPQLDGVGNRGRDRLCEDILDPNQNVDRAFRTQIVVLRNGDVAAGLLRRHEGKVLVLAESTGKERSIPDQEIKEQRESELSLMPDNFGEVLSPAEFNHLLAFLLSKGTAGAAKR